MGFASLSAASSCARSSFFSASGTDLSALSAAISFLICSGGSVNFLVCWSMPDMIIKIFIDTTSYSARLAKAVLLNHSLGLRLHLRIRFVRSRAIVELCNLLVGSDEALNMLLGEFDLLHLLPSGHAGIKQSESQKRREQHTQKVPTPITNERHCMALHLECIACTSQFWPRHDGNRTDGDVDYQCLRQRYAMIAWAVYDQGSGQSGHGASEKLGSRTQASTSPFYGTTGSHDV